MHKDDEKRRRQDRGDKASSQPGAHATRRDEPVQSRSADPGQSSYGGFSNQDPRFQRQKLDDYTRGRGPAAKAADDGEAPRGDDDDNQGDT
ncbi:MAG: hypothetical protein WBF88_11565 [Pusillimonas sp.]